MAFHLDYLLLLRFYPWILKHKIHKIILGLGLNLHFKFTLYYIWSTEKEKNFLCNS